MCLNFLQLTRGKTEVAVLGAKAERFKVTEQLQTFKLETTDYARNPGAIMDSDLNFNNHIKTVIDSEVLTLATCQSEGRF